MSYPATIDAPDTTMLGTSLVATDDHALQHRTVAGAVIAIETVMGTNSGTSVLKNLTAGNFVAKQNNDTFGSPTINGGTFSNVVDNNSTIGSPSITGGTDTGLLRILGSIAYNGTVNGTTTLQLGSANRHLVYMPNSAGSVQLAVVNVVPNQPTIVEIMQGTSGLGTVGWFPTISIRWAGSAVPVLTTSASRKDSFGFIATGGTTMDAYILGQNV